MLVHYLSMAARNLTRRKLFSIINIAGMSIAMVCAIAVGEFVRYELSYDAWIPTTANLYRLEETVAPPGQSPMQLAMCSFPLLTALQAQIPQVRAVVHLNPEKMTVSVGDRHFLETVTVVDPNFFQLIRLPLVAGDPRSVLSNPESIVLSEAMATKLFGDADPIGRVVKVSGVAPDECKSSDSACFYSVHSLKVTGVLRNLPPNTQLVADLMVPNTSQADEVSQADKQHDWLATDGNIGYLELASNAKLSQVIDAAEGVLDRSVGTLGGTHKASEFVRFHLVPFRQVHLTGGEQGEMKPTVSRTTVYGFAIIALLIVLVACCNFINLATAQATLRAKETGVRKLGGATHLQLVAQFLLEAIFISGISLVIAIGLVEILRPAYGSLFGEPLPAGFLSDWKVLVCLAAGAVLAGLLSGIYPAFVLSRFRPGVTLRGAGGRLVGSGLMRAVLVVGQFAVSIGLGIATVVVFREIQFMRGIDPGFDRNDVMVIKSIGNIPPDARVRLARILDSESGIEGAALSNAVPFDIRWTPNAGIKTAGGSQPVSMHVFEVSPTFPQLYRIPLLAGRFLSDAHAMDIAPDWREKNVLINADAARRLGLTPERAVGATIEDGDFHLHVVGVLANSMRETLVSPVDPSVYVVDQDRYGFLSIRMRARQIPQGIASVEKAWQAVAPGVAMDAYFVSDAFNGLFESDQRQDTLLAILTGIAVLIACLGLIGLAVFTAERHTKEVGMRKVSGATTSDIVWLMLWRISLPVLIANLLAWPVAYYCLHRWLEGYADRISLNPLYFLVAGAAALGVAWATVYTNTLRLARGRPTDALRYE